MIEIEKKVALSSSTKEAVLAFADRHNIVFTSPVEEADVYYRPKGFRSRPKARSDYLVRIRCARGEYSLNLKMLTATSGVIDERETSIGDAKAAGEILVLMGAEFACSVKKSRRRALHNGIALLLDEVADLGDFLEVSVEVDDTVKSDDALRRVDEFITQLGVDPQMVETRGYPDIILEAEGVYPTS